MEESLEEAANKYESTFGVNAQGTEGMDFIEGAKWQQERSYSEEEVLKLLHNREQYLIETLGEFYKSNLEWFEQFKKK